MSVWHWLALFGLVLVLIPWVLYPIAMASLGRRVGDQADSHTESPRAATITVVIATRAPPDAVRLRLENLVQGNWPAERLELVVAVDGDPAPYKFLGLHPPPRRLMVVARAGNPGKAAALNAGVAAATSELVVFTDTAQQFAPDTLARLVEAMAKSWFGAVSGALELGNETAAHSPIATYWRMERRLRGAEARVHSAIGVSGSVYIMRRALWSPLPAGLILDDLWIPMRLILAGHRVGFAEAAVARDFRTTTTGQEFRRKVRTLTGNLQLVAWLPSVLAPWRNPVWVQFLCHKLLRLLTPQALLLLGVGMIGSAFTFSPAVGWWLVGAGIGGTILGSLLPGGIGRRIRGGLAWGLSMQGAILMATWNGVRGRWDVWQA